MFFVIFSLNNKDGDFVLQHFILIERDLTIDSAVDTFFSKSRDRKSVV